MKYVFDPVAVVAIGVPQGNHLQALHFTLYMQYTTLSGDPH